MALTDASCRQSEACLNFGACSALDGVCRALSDADCRHPASKACSYGGRCVANGFRCVAHDEGACKQSWACADTGACHRGRGGGCEPKDGADCQRSFGCPADGTGQKCDFLDGDDNSEGRPFCGDEGGGC